MSSFKVGDIVRLIQGEQKLGTYVYWAQELIKNKVRCKVQSINGSTIYVLVMEGAEKGRQFHTRPKAFIKISSIDDLEVEEL